jgi:GntR family transcriptional regulator/MocR family aminotransferase
VDAEGLDVAAGVARGAEAKLVYVTPSRQFPLGVTMSLRRRLELLAWATQVQAWILEDDYDSEYRYSGRPLASLQGLDRDARVIYLGTFSKVLFSALRMAYLVVPADVVDAFTMLRVFSRHPPASTAQYVLAAFLAEGHFARHIRRMRALYAHRQQALVDAAQRELGGLLHVPSTDAGMHLVGWLPEGVDDEAVSRRDASQGYRSPVISLHARGALAPSLGARLPSPQRTRHPQEHPPVGLRAASLMMPLVDQHHVPVEAMAIAARHHVSCQRVRSPQRRPL